MSISPSTPSLQVTVNSKQILAISLPIALAIMVPQVNFVINNIFLGALSSEALAIGGITGVLGDSSEALKDSDEVDSTDTEALVKSYGLAYLDSY